jgi:hypothetical protein
VTLLAADDRAYLTVGRPARYALGDPAAPALILNAVDAAGCMWWAEVPEGWDAAELTTPLYGPIRLPTAQGEGGYPMGATGALMPWTSAAGPAALTVAAVRNQGDEPAHAVYRVTGPVPRPRIVLGTGEFVALDADLGALDTWTVDTTTGTSTVNGVNRYDAWAAGSTFPLIPASDPVAGTSGGTEVRLRSGAGGTDQAAGLTVTTAPSWK